jgi:hypothetical protein
MGLARSVLTDVGALVARHRQATHDRAQNEKQADPLSGEPSKVEHAPGNDGRVGAAQREEEVDQRRTRHARRRRDVNARGIHQVAHPRTLRAEVLRATFQMVETVHTPIPFAAIEERRTQVVTQPLPQRIGRLAMQRGAGRRYGPPGPGPCLAQIPSELRTL